MILGLLHYTHLPPTEEGTARAEAAEGSRVKAFREDGGVGCVIDFKDGTWARASESLLSMAEQYEKLVRRQALGAGGWE